MKKTENEKSKMLGTPDALLLVAERGPEPVTLPTLIDWCRKYNLGVKIGGRWYVYEDRLTQFLTEGKGHEKKEKKQAS
jgi:hypothetical protein